MPYIIITNILLPSMFAQILGIFNNPDAGGLVHPQARRVAPPGVKTKKQKSSSGGDDIQKTKIRV